MNEMGEKMIECTGCICTADLTDWPIIPNVDCPIHGTLPEHCGVVHRDMESSIELELWETDKGYYWIVDDVVIGYKESEYYKTIEEAYAAIGIVWELESK